MILVALGSNLEGPWGDPRETVLRALEKLDKDGSRLIVASPLVVTSPFGRLNQPAFVNAVAQIETHLPPEALMRKLHSLEREAGRRRAVRWGPRTLDLDLIDYRGLVLRKLQRAGATRPLILPHPGIAERIFVLQPIAMIAPSWRHPVTHLSAREMLRRIGSVAAGQIIHAEMIP